MRKAALFAAAALMIAACTPPATKVAVPPAAPAPVAAVTPPAAPNRAIADPVAFVTDVYRQLAANEGYAPPEDIYTPRLADLWALERRDAGDEVGRIDFEFWVNAQDWELKDVRVTSRAVENGPDRMVVIARFKNISRAEQIRFYFQKVDGNWMLDDARSISPDGGWTLSTILKYGWDDAP